jgi:hypothetical protein
MATLKLYLTSLEPDLGQSVYSQSIGGYASSSLIYPETTLTSSLGLYDDDFNLDTPPSGNWLEWQGVEYINIGNEVIRISPLVDGSITNSIRAYNNISNMHISGDIVRASSSKDLFNDVFNEDHKQYRCVAIKNISRSSTDPSDEQNAYNLEVYLKQNSRSINSTIKMALERPSSDYLEGQSTSWNAMQLIDESLIDMYADDHFKESYLQILSGGASGQGKVVSSFDSSTGTFTFYSSFSEIFDFTTNVSYEVQPAPSQRVKTGIVAPQTGNLNVSNFFSPTSESSLSFFELGSDFNMGGLAPNNVVYLWIEREVRKGSPELLHNDFVINLRYSVRE